MDDAAQLFWLAEECCKRRAASPALVGSCIFAERNISNGARHYGRTFAGTIGGAYTASSGIETRGGGAVLGFEALP
jgi:hypothetical protein